MHKITYIFLLLLTLKNSEGSEGWYNNTLCMANQTSGFTPSAVTPNSDFAALDNTIGALALWWIPLGVNILRCKWNQRKIREKIGTELTKDNVLQHHVIVNLKKRRAIEHMVYDCLHQRQFHHVYETHSFLTEPTVIMNEYVGNDLTSPEHKYAAYMLYVLLLHSQREREVGIPEMSEVVTDYLFDDHQELQEIASDQDKIHYQPLLNQIPLPLTMRSMPTVLLRESAFIRNLYYAGKYWKHTLCDGGVSILWRGKYSPERLVSLIASPVSVAIQLSTGFMISKYFDKARNILRNDPYLYIGQALCCAVNIHASDLLFNHLVLQKVG